MVLRGHWRNASCVISQVKPLFNWIKSVLGRGAFPQWKGGRGRGPATHVVILDGTLSSLETGHETHAGQLYKLLLEAGVSANLTVYYEPGIQWNGWAGTMDVIQGRGINRQITRAYGVLASRYREGDRIVLVGYSRGAYAVRSLAGVIDLVGLIDYNYATERNVKLAYRHYRRGGKGKAAEAFCEKFCLQDIEIEAVAVWDTVKALGVRLPLLWRFSEVKNAFHNHSLGHSIRHGFHALALDERRQAYEPVLWTCPEGWDGKVMQQMWFAGTHGDVGGQLTGYEPARPLANIPFVWMMEQLEACNVPLPEDWAARFPIDPHARSIGGWRGLSKLFLARRARVVGEDPSEKVHETVAIRNGTDAASDAATN